MRTLVKVCGITCYEDAALALDLGADALGFNFYPPSPRFIDFAGAREIIRRLPPLAVSVGVFVNVPDPAEVDAGARASGVQVVQLHGDESSDYCRRLDGWPLIKSFRVGAEWEHGSLAGFPARAILLDARDVRLYGGTGRTFDWSLATAHAGGLKVILAGGLTAANVSAAIRIARPYAVDVCSGIERAPGKKDPARLAAFMDEVSHAHD